MPLALGRRLLFRGPSACKWFSFSSLGLRVVRGRFPADSTMVRNLVGITLSILLPAAAAQGESIRRWVDKDGVVHFSNVKKGEKSSATYLPTKDGGVRVVLEGKKEEAKARSTRSFRPRNSSEFDHFLREACERYRIPLSFARAITAAESNFDPRAISRAGAMGLMQLMPATAVSMYVEDAFDPKENVFGGVRYLRVLTNLFDGDLVKVIAAYNAGPEAVRKAGGVPNYPETQTYVKRVLQLYREYQEREAEGGR